MLWYLAIFALGELAFGAGMWFILRQNLYDLVDDGIESQVDDLKSFLEAQKKDATFSKLQEEVNETLFHRTYRRLSGALRREWRNSFISLRFLQAHPSVALAARSGKASTQPKPSD